MRNAVLALCLVLMAVPAGALVPAALERTDGRTQDVRVPARDTGHAVPDTGGSATRGLGAWDLDTPRLVPLAPADDVPPALAGRHNTHPTATHRPAAPVPVGDGGVRIGHANPPRNMARSMGNLEFYCPPTQDILGVPLPAAVQGDDPVVSGCPIRVYDTGWHFGDAHVVVNDERPNEAAFFSKHGQATQGGPTETARSGRTHVAFTTTSAQSEWQDQPTEQGYPSGELGDRASGTMDSDGNIYAMYSWHRPYAEKWSSVIGLFKGPTADVQQGMIQAYYDPFFVEPRDAGGYFTEPHVIRVKSHIPIIVQPANDTADAPAGEEGNGESAIADLANMTPERIVATWHETAYDWSNTTTGLSGFIDIAWTDTGGENNWTYLNRTQLIGPCRAASNPVGWEGKVYIGCVVERGYDHRPRARVGHVDIWSFDLRTGNTTFVDSSRLFGGRPLLAANEDGYMALVVQRKNFAENGTFLSLEVETSFGYYGRRWEQSHGEIGTHLHRFSGWDLPLLDADVTAIALTTDEPTVFMVYKEWHNDPQDPLILDPEDPAAMIGNRLTDYNKYLTAFDSCDFPIAFSQVELGHAVDTANAQQYELNSALFNDVSDGLYVNRGEGGGELVWFAINDYGAMQFGAAIADSVADAAPCFDPPPPPPILPAALPQALSISTGYTWAAGAALGVPALAMVLYLLTAKKRNPVTVAVEDR